MPASKLVSQTDFHRHAQAGRARGLGVLKTSTTVPRVFDDGSRKVRFCFSDGSVDRLGDTIDPKGWDTSDFKLNPVALWSHAASEPPIGRASNVGVEGTRLMGTIEFAPPETYEFADTVFKLVIGKWLNACSVGFLPTRYSFVENDPDRGWGIDFKEQQLLEISIVAIPANSHALIDAAKSIDLRPLSRWAQRALDGNNSTLGRADLVRLRDLAREAPRSRAGDLARSAEIKARVGVTLAPRGDDRRSQIARARAWKARIRLI